MYEDERTLLAETVTTRRLDGNPSLERMCLYGLDEGRVDMCGAARTTSRVGTDRYHSSVPRLLFQDFPLISVEAGEGA